MKTSKSENLSYTVMSTKLLNTVADPGFPRGGGTNPKGGVPTYYLINFSRKLHENEEILGVSRAPPPDPPLKYQIPILISRNELSAAQNR